MRQKRILLSFIEPVNLIHEYDRPLARSAGLYGCGHDVLDFFDTGQDGAERNECGLGHFRDDLCESRLAHAWRSPQDHRRDLISFDCCSQRFAGLQQMPLPEYFVQRFRSHAVGEWSVDGWTGRLVFFKEESAHFIDGCVLPFISLMAAFFIEAARSQQGESSPQLP